MKKIICVDASVLKYSACSRRLFLDAAIGYSQGKDSNDLLYGTCFHKYVELVAKGANAAVAMSSALKHWDDNIHKCAIKYTAKFLDRVHLENTLTEYFSQSLYNPIFTKTSYAKVGEQVLAECKFSIPIYSDDTLDILLQGTIDGIFQIDGGCTCIGDWKTTRNNKPQDYFLGYKMSRQLRVYQWAIQWYLANYPDSPLAQAFSKTTKIGTFIYGAFLSSGERTKFERSDLFFFNQLDIDAFDSMLKTQVNKLVINSDIFDAMHVYPPPEGIMNDACQKDFGSYCKYFGACSSIVGLGDTEDSRSLFEAILKNNFTIKDYRPLNFGGGEVEKKEINTK